MLHGTIHPDFAGVATALRNILPKNGPGGAAVCVYHKGQKVVDVWGGTRDRMGNPWNEDTISVSFSTTKGVASTLLHIYADRGLIDYDTPVREYWPEYARAGKENTTVRQLTCHEAGLYAIDDLLDDAQNMLDWDGMVERFGAATPRHAPGTAHGYHALSYGYLVGEVVRRVAGGKSFAQLIDEEIAQPLGLDGLFCGVPEDQLERSAELMMPLADKPEDERRKDTAKRRRMAETWGQRLRRIGIKYDPMDSLSALMPKGMDMLDMNGAEFRRASIPAANGMFTARSLARMYACLAHGGELDGVRLVSEETVRRLSEVQNRGAGKVIPISMNWRMGYHRVFAVRANIGAGFGHFGFGGSGAWADPQRQLAVALTVNSGVGTPFGDARIARIGGAAARCADGR